MDKFLCIVNFCAAISCFVNSYYLYIWEYCIAGLFFLCSGLMYFYIINEKL